MRANVTLIAPAPLVSLKCATLLDGQWQEDSNTLELGLQPRNSAGFAGHCDILNKTTLLFLLTTVTEWLTCSPPTTSNRVQSPARPLPDFRPWESCRTMPLVGGFSQGSPVSPTLSFRHCSILTPTNFISSQDLAVKEPPKSLHSVTTAL
ncbi:hypothetical protein PR048_027189 [Dryococelus australis]|uniref:Uncharacterized protein n=1 Tax=Dryococelus australis TaxID=614101 RepID=A0ABQ9GF02_9NEOP|nr:hypothetical protein PR048_027189 [Dryococelus australis]